MGKKIALNVFYNLLLILCLWGAVWAYRHDNVLLSIFLGAAFAAVFYFKVQLTTSVRKGK